AWGTVSQILQAFQRFMAFLKAVKTGAAGPQFAAALAAAAVAVIDFVSNWLLLKLAKGLAKLGGKLKGIAQRLGKKRKLKKKKKAAKAKAGKKAHKKKPRAKPKRKKKPERRGKGGKSRKDKKKDDAERKKRERLEKAVQAIRPKLDAVLKRGTTPWALRARLFMWKVYYRLSALTLQPDGEVVAKVNPTYALEGGKKLPGKKLGELLMPVLVEAERQHRKALQEDPKTRQQIEEAKEKFDQGKPVPPLRRDLEQEVLRSGSHKTGSQGRELSPGAVYRFDDPDRLSTTIVGGKESYPTLLLKVKGTSAALGLSSVDTFKLLSNSSAQLEAELQKHWASGKFKGKRALFLTFSAQIRRVSSLSQSLEPARREGVGTPSALAHSLGATEKATGKVTGHTTLQEVTGRSGSLGVMTAKGSSSSKPTSHIGRKGTKAVQTRIGNVFIRLREAAESVDALVSRGGYDLSKLVSAVDKWIKIRIKTKEGKDLEEAATALIAELRAFMQAYFAGGP
ncbi:MAG TPA: hypothetical protein VMW27_27105, partial [Thermoanaerobaculia bacterium]|nr:hypothetical protein [Thermoanaerobaculia bacterium]